MLSTILAAIQEWLEPVAKSVTGDNEVARHLAPPRYVFVRKGFSVENPSSLGGNPRSLHDTLYTLEVRCWGRTEDEADRLWLALPTAVRTVMLGHNYAFGGGRFAAVQDSHRGYLWMVDLTLRLTTPLVRRETGAPDAEREAVVIDANELEAPPGTPGDAQIEPGD